MLDFTFARTRRYQPQAKASAKTLARLSNQQLRLQRSAGTMAGIAEMGKAMIVTMSAIQNASRWGLGGLGTASTHQSKRSRTAKAISTA